MFFYSVDADGNMPKRVMVQYWFDGGKHVVKPVPHGNSKKNKLPFMRTRESMKEKLHVAVSTKEPRQTYYDTKAVIGKMMDLPSTSAAPRASCRPVTLGKFVNGVIRNWKVA